jgi:hypothetical protein
MLTGWLRGTHAGDTDAGALEPAIFADLVERNRFDAITWVALPEGPLREALADRLASWRNAYEQGLIRNMRQLAAALQVGERLETGGIPAIGLRGPFAGVALYRDIALRHFTDVDLLIPAEKRDEAWEILNDMGYRFSHPFMTRGACARHHLEWPFRHAGNGLSLDLHWALDHPYKLLRVNYGDLFTSAGMCAHPEGDWREPCREDALILTCMHAEKECRLRGRAPSAALVRAQGRSGLWRHWLDLALLLRDRHDLDWSHAVTRAEAWGVLEHVAATTRAASDLFDMGLPASLAKAADGLKPRHRVRRRRLTTVPRPTRSRAILGRYGFRGECLQDVPDYLLPASGHFAGAKGIHLLFCRVLHTARGAGRLLQAGIEFAWLNLRQARLHGRAPSGATASGSVSE